MKIYDSTRAYDLASAPNSRIDALSSAHVFALLGLDNLVVVPTFYAVYTATGWLNSLVFMDRIDAYSNWVCPFQNSLTQSADDPFSFAKTLFAIFISICILIFGVVLLTSKKPEASASARSGDRRALVIAPQNARRQKGRSAAGQSISSSSPILGHEDDDMELGDEENDVLRPHDEEGEHQMWQIGGDDEDDETGDNKRDEQSHESGHHQQV